MRQYPANRISKKALSVWRLKGTIETVLLLAVPLGLYFAGDHFQLSIIYFWAALAAVIIYGILRIAVYPLLKWKAWRYEVFEQEIELLRGIIVIKHTLIPMARVQHVDTEQGPLYKNYGLTVVTISTAAGIHEIPALTEQTGGELRDHIAKLAGMDKNNE